MLHWRRLAVVYQINHFYPVHLQVFSLYLLFYCDLSVYTVRRLMYQKPKNRNKKHWRNSGGSASKWFLPQIHRNTHTLFHRNNKKKKENTKRNKWHCIHTTKFSREMYEKSEWVKEIENIFGENRRMIHSTASHPSESYTI